MSPRDLGNSDVSRPAPRGRELPDVAFRSDMVIGAKKRKTPQSSRFRLYCFHCHGFRICGKEKTCPKCGMTCRS